MCIMPEFKFGDEPSANVAEYFKASKEMVEAYIGPP